MRAFHELAVLAASSVSLALVTGCGGGGGGSSTGPPPVEPGALTLTTVATITGGGAHMPVLAISPPGDRDRLFVVDKAGLIRVVRRDTLLTTPFLDLHTIVTSGNTEQGLLGLAFSPNYATDKSFYVCYNDLNWAVTVARYQVSPNPEVADPTSAQVIISQYHHDASNHNGGMIAFGPDGYLYFSLGDGGNQGDPNGTGQNPNDLLGSILRLDVSGGTAGYTTPAGNPFPDTSHPGGAPEVWCFGLRNPWRFSFDRSTGDLYIGDVGQDDYEEIDVATGASGRGRGVNYGWNVMEGDHCTPPAASCVRLGLTLPAVSYPHDANQNCVIGGFVYRGTAMPGLAGTYFYSDNLGKYLRSFRYVGGVATSLKDWGVNVGDPVNAFGQDAKGELYVCCFHGAVKRIGP